MVIKFSRHSKKQMKWRKISENDVRETVIKPERIANSIKGKKNAFRNIHNKRLKVTFKEKNDKITIITVIDKNKWEE